MTYSQTVEYLFSQLPMYQRIGQAAYKANLDNTFALCKMLGNPEKNLRCVHVAGTNGKGSVTHTLSSIFQEAGYKTGLYTSPHLKDFRERIKINGEMIAESEVVRFVEKFRTQFEPIQPSFFEITWGMALHHFEKNKVDIAIIETGMGGRLDSTNVVLPEISIITSIGLDHTQFLGDTLEKIAVEKSGIIKQAIPVVIGPGNDEVKHVFKEIAAEKDTFCWFAEEESGAPLPTSLKGDYQQDNMKTVRTATRLLKEKGWKLEEEQILRGAMKVEENTGLMGRWQTLSTNPLTICDIGHNEDGIKQVVKMIGKTPHRNLHMVIGTVNDKNIRGMISLLPKSANYYFCRAAIPRALPENELLALAADLGLKGAAYPSVHSAYQSAREAAGEDDLIFIGGSAFVVAEVV